VTDHKLSVFKFEDIEVREREFLLVKGEKALPVEPQAFRVLLFLLRNPKRLVTKVEILNAAWNECAVSDNSLTRSIATLRRLLGDDSREPRFIATVPTLGYRFLCNVVAAEEGVNGFATQETHLPPETDTNGLSKPQFRPVRKRLFGLSLAGSCILAVGIIAAGFLIRQAASKRDVHGPFLPHLATEERITSNPPEAPVEGAVLSRDGKYLAFHDSSGLYLRQIADGETRTWRLPKDFVAWPNDWFPDGTHLLVTRREGSSRTLSLWKLSLFGGNPEKLMDDATAGSVSPDGSRIAYVPGPEFGSELWVMDSDGANARRAAFARKPDRPNLGNGWIQRPAWSPNGARLAYVESHLATIQADPPLFANSLLTRDANGGDLQVVLKDDSRLRSALCWTANGRILFAYLNDPAGEREDTGVDSISIDERTGKTAGPAQRVTEGEGWIGGLSATSDGKRLVVSRGNTTRQVFITEPDPGNHRWRVPRRLTLDTNESLATAWTADSKAVLFASDRNGTWKLFKQNVDETTADVLVEGHSMRFPRLSADGSQVLYLAESQPGDHSLAASLMSKPLAGGPPRLVLRENEITNYQCARAPSKLCMFSKLVGSDHILVSFDLEHGAGREITRTPGGASHWSLSPDGSRLALVLGPRRIRFLSPDTGAAHDVSLNDWPVFNVDWSADGERLFVRSITPAGVPVILALNEAGKAEVVIEGRVGSHFAFFIESPDGRHGILEMPTPGDNNAWMVENF
jgi:DNA-binding winged helix-turn-helix (wHTH) protein/Tol biopolymer transport system component